MQPLTTLFKALGDETRFTILNQLIDGEKCVCELYPVLDRKQSTISTQLAKLENLGIIKSKRNGKNMLYRIIDYRVCEILKLLGHIKGKRIENCCGIKNDKTQVIK